MSRSGAVLLAFALVAPLSAQIPYGAGSAGSGGIVPVISCRQAWMGNVNWGVTVSSGLGSSSALLAICPAPASLVAGGIPLHVDLAQPLFILGPSPMNGAPGAPGAGSIFFPLALPGPPIAALAGFRAYAQAGIVDPAAASGVAVTSGLRIEVTYPPQVFVGSSVGGSADPYWLIDPVAQVLQSTGGVTATDNVNGAAYANGGLDLYVLSSFGALSVADLSSGSPVWSTVRTFTSSGGVAEGGVQIDAEDKRLWVVADNGTGSMELVCIDIDRASPTWGQVLANTTNLSATVGLIGTWGLSPSGRAAVVPSLLGGNIYIFDLDFGSPTFLQMIDNAPIPGGVTAFWLNNDVAFSPDETTIYVLRQGTGTTPTEVARYYRPIQAWLDHNSATPGIDNIGPTSLPPVNMPSAGTGLSVAADGSFIAVSGFGGVGWAGKIAVDPTLPGYFAWTQITAVALPNAWRCAVNPDSNVIAVASSQLHLFDAATLALQASIPIGGGGSQNIAWR